MALPEFISPPPGIPPDHDPEAFARWRITDNRQAEWVMRKLAHASERLAAVEAEHAVYLEQLDEWYLHATAADRRDAEWARGLLTEWALCRREDDPEAKTQHLPSGQVATKWVPPHPRVADPGGVAASLAHAQHPAYDAIVSAQVSINTPALAKATELADEWLVDLSCGCTVTAWHVGGGDANIDVRMAWPWRPDEHTGAECSDPVVVASFKRGRRAVIVVSTGDGEVLPVDGVEVVPGRLSASVRPTQAQVYSP